MRWLWAWRESARFNRTKDELVGALPRDTRFTGSVYEFETTTWRSPFPLRYEWEITRESDQYRLTETAYISASWYWLLVASLFVSTAVGVGEVFIRDEASAVLSAVSLTGMGVTVLLLIVFERASKPVFDLFRQSESTGEVIPVATFLLIAIPLVLISAFFSGPLRWVSVAALLLWAVAYERKHSWIVRWSIWWQTSFITMADRLPLVLSNYVAVLLFVSLPPFAFIQIYDQPAFLYFFSTYPWWVFAFGLALLSLVTGFLAGIVGKSHRYERSTIQQERHVDTKVNPGDVDIGRSTLISILIAVAVALGFGWLGVHYARAAAAFLNVYPQLPAYGLVLVIGALAAYVGVGLLYQFASFFTSIGRLLVRSRPEGSEGLLDTDAEIRVLDTGEPFAGAVDLGFKQYIFLSSELIETLGERQLAAILAHEEAHLKYGDARLATLVAVISPLLLVGKNGIYAVLGYRNREYRADLYAAQEVGTQALADALETVRDAEWSHTGGGTIGIAPTMVSFDTSEDNPSISERLVEFHFGDFAMTQIHPTVQERLAAVDDSL